MSAEAARLVALLRTLRNERDLAGQRRFGITSAGERCAAIAEAKRVLKLDTPPARWIARDALRELDVA